MSLDLWPSVERIPRKFKKPTKKAIKDIPYDEKGLSIIVYWLRSMCHAEYCNETGCPLQCCRQNDDPMLDLETSIAWEAADAIHFGWSTHSGRGQVALVVQTLLNVVERHHKRHALLTDILYLASCIAWDAHLKGG